MPSDLPLRGRRVVVTRPALQAQRLCDSFARAGADVIAIPSFRLQAADGSPLEGRLRADGRVDADTVVFTSGNAVDFFFELAGGAGVLSETEVAAIGPATVAALERHGARVNVTADPHTAEGMVAALRSSHRDMSGRRVLYPRAADARDVIESMLTSLGARVDSVVTYGAVPETLADREGTGAALDIPPDVITFASPSAAIHLEATLSPAIFARVAAGLKTRSMTACIGPVTAEAVRRLGYRVTVVADTYTAEGLVNAVIDYYQKEH